MTGRRGLVLLLALVAAEVLWLYPGVLHGEIVSSSALGYGLAPWRGAVPETERPLRGNPVLSDDLFLLTPWDMAVRGALEAGAPPVWDPNVACGAPLLANNQSAVLAPTQWLRLAWRSPRARTVGLLTVPLLAAAGGYLLLMGLGGGVTGALVGGLAWSNAALFTTWLLYPLAETAAWFGCVAAAVVGLLGRQAPPRWLPAATAAALAATLLAGHLPTAVAFLTAGVALVPGWAMLDRSVWRRLSRLLLPFAAGIALAAPQLLPTAEYLVHSAALAARSAAPPARSVLPWEAAWSWLVPEGFGAPQVHGYAGAVNFNEATATVGLAALLLAMVALAAGRGRARWGFAALAALAGAAAYGLPPVTVLLAHLPVLRLVPGLRWVLVAQWAVAALAGLGTAALLDRGRRRRALWATAGAGALLLAGVSLHPAARGGEAPRDVAAALEVVGSAGELIGAGAAAAVAALVPPAAPAVLAAAVTAGGLRLATGFVPTIPPEAVPGPTLATKAAAAAAGEGRVLPLGWTLPPNSHVLAGLASPRGWDAVNLARAEDLRQAAGWDRADAGWPLGAGGLELARRAAVGAVLSDRPRREPGLEPLSAVQGPRLWGYRLPGAHPMAAWYAAAVPVEQGEALPRLLSGTVPASVIVLEGAGGGDPRTPPRRLEAVQAGPGSLVVEVDTVAPGWVVWREAAAPGWRARIDGAAAPVQIADGLFLAVPVAAGAHRVTLSYRPWTWRAGLVLATLGAVLAFVSLVLPQRRKTA